MIEGLSKFLHRAAVFFIGALLVLSPWCFGSVEMWWFWPMTALLAAACFCSGAATLLPVLRDETSWADRFRHRIPTRAFVAFAAWLPMVVYALARTGIRTPGGGALVWMEAERSLLLFITPLALALVMMLSSRGRSRRVLMTVVLVNAAVMAVYSLINHFVTDDRMILWVGANDFDYRGRLSAPFYCPNQAAAYFYIIASAFISGVFGKGAKARSVAVCVFGALLASAACALTLSRGGNAAFALALLIVLPVLGLRGRRAWVRVVCGAFMVAAVVSAAFAVRYTDNPLMDRVKAHGIWRAWEESGDFGEFKDRFSDVFWHGFDRGWYIGSALRAWESSPVIGIGPGQHTHRWAQFAATPDGVKPENGDPATLKWPRLLNDGYHLYEVHSDWVQLLEEYGWIGVCLFLLGLVCTFAVVVACNASVCVPLFAAALVFHSFVDFSLQMPAVVWLAAFFTAEAVLGFRETDEPDSEDD